MRDATPFSTPGDEWEKQQEGLRTSCVDRLPAQAAACCVGYAAAEDIWSQTLPFD